MLEAARKVMSFFKMLVYGIIPTKHDNAWDTYRRARVLAAEPVSSGSN